MCRGFRLLRLWVCLVVLFLVSRPAYADNGPHGGYTATTDACAACHRAHTAVGASLLAAGSVTELCYTCHGASGTGADTNVEDGVYLDRDATPNEGDGEVNRGLKGGGFVNARMDTDWDGAAVPASVTSTHVLDASGTVWGSGAIGSGPGGTIFLTCASCHNPHGRAASDGSATYRLLRAIPYESGNTAVDVPDVDPKAYTITAADDKYFGEDYSNVSGQDLTGPLANWCATCHDRYLASAGSGSTSSGDPIFTYRHKSVGTSPCSTCHDMHGGTLPQGNGTYMHRPMTCLTCHVAHGTSASMSGWAAQVSWPDGSTVPNGDARSSLLRVDSRGICQLCHER